MVRVITAVRAAVAARWIFALAAGALVLAAVSTVTGEAIAAEAKKGGTVTMGLESDLRGFDPIKARVLGFSAATVIDTIEEKLFDIDADGNIVPMLATSAEMEEGGESWLIKLRRGVTFHDGTPFNADAVAGHWNRVLNPYGGYIGILFIAPMKSVQKVDDYTVRFHLRHAWVPFMGALASLGGFPGFIPSPKAVKEGTHNRAPVGTGPFMFKEWKSGDRITVVRNPNYWKKGEPNLDKIVFRFLPDQQTRLASLKAGDIDVMWTDRGTSILAAMKDKSLLTHQFDGTGGGIWLLNNSKPPLDDPRVRQAISHAYNQAVIVKTMWRDTVPVVPHPFGSLLDCGDAGYRQNDIAEAKKLIAAYGKPVEVEMIHTTTPRGREAGELMQQLLKRAGIKVVLKPVDQLQLRKLVFTNNYQISGWRLVDGQDQGPQLFGLLHSDSDYDITHYNEPAMNKLLEEQRKSLDEAKRGKALCGVAERINRDAMMLYAGGKRHYAFTRRHVKGVPPLRFGIVRFKKVWLEPVTE